MTKTCLCSPQNEENLTTKRLDKLEKLPGCTLSHFLSSLRLEAP